MTQQEIEAEIARQIADHGLFIKAHWEAFRLASIPDNAPQVQIDEMRRSFYAGASVFFGSIKDIVGEDREVYQGHVAAWIDKELMGFLE